jgi:hypothetical protein
MKTPHKLHMRSLLSAYNGEAENPYLWSSPNWMAWEAIHRAHLRGLTVIDAWCGRGCAVNIRTPDSVTSVNVL